MWEDHAIRISDDNGLASTLRPARRPVSFWAFVGIISVVVVAIELPMAMEQPWNRAIAFPFAEPWRRNKPPLSATPPVGR